MRSHTALHFRFISWHTEVCFPLNCIKAWYSPESLFCEQRIVSRCVFLTMQGHIQDFSKEVSSGYSFTCTLRSLMIIGKGGLFGAHPPKFLKGLWQT